jgi:hypothetical protein
MQTLLGSQGDDTFIFPGTTPLGVATLDSGGGHDRLEVNGNLDLGDLTLIGNWTIAAAQGATATFTLTDESQIGMIDGQGANLTIDATALNLTAEQRAELFSEGAQSIEQAGGLFFTATTAERSGPVTAVASGEVLDPAATLLVDGDTVVTWDTPGQDGYLDVHLQRFDASGAKLGAETIVNTTLTETQDHSSITSLTDGGFVVTWENTSSDDSHYNTHAQIFDASGNKVGAEFTIGGLVADTGTLSRVVATSDGGFLIARSAGNVDVTRYDNLGHQVGSQVQVNTGANPSYFDAAPGLATLTDGGFVVSWVTAGVVNFRQYDSSGHAIGGQTTVPGPNLDSDFTTVTAMKDGGYLVTWDNFGTFTSPVTVSAQRYDSSGAAVGATIHVGSNADYTLAGPPTVFSDGSFIVTYRDEGSSPTDAGAGVYNQRYDSNGDAVGGPQLISPVGTTFTPVVTALPGDSYITTWEASFDTNSTSEIDQRTTSPLDYHVLTAGADIIDGSAADTWIVVAQDTLNPTDHLTGGSGANELELSASGVADLASLAAFSGFQQIFGASGDDTFVVNSTTLADVTLMDGREGTNIIQLAAPGVLDLSHTTLDNIEELVGSSGNDTFLVGSTTLAGVTTIDGGAGTNILELAAPGMLDLSDVILKNIAKVVGSSGDDTFILNKAGAVALDGGAGVNVADYSTLTSNLKINTSTGVVTGADFGTDHLTNIQIVFGGSGQDNFVAGLGAHVFVGGAGVDTLELSKGPGDYTITSDGHGDYVVSAAGVAIGLMGVEQIKYDATGKTVTLADVTSAPVSSADATAFFATLNVAATAPAASYVETRAGTQDGSAATNDVLTGADGHNTFFFKLAATTGADEITNFGKTDVIATDSPLSDGNGDGIIKLGYNGLLNLDGSEIGDSVKIDGISNAGLRLMGQDNGVFVYADASVRPQNAIESHIGSETLIGDAGDAKSQTFFYDTALGLNLGSDTIKDFGAKDILVTTTAFSDGNGDGVITDSAKVFHLSAPTDGSSSPDGPGTVAMSDASNTEIDSLKYDGVVSHDGVNYYVYSGAHATAGLSDLHFSA